MKDDTLGKQSVKDTCVDMILQTRDRQHLDTILTELRDVDYTVQMLDPYGLD